MDEKEGMISCADRKAYQECLAVTGRPEEQDALNRLAETREDLGIEPRQDDSLFQRLLGRIQTDNIRKSHSSRAFHYLIQNCRDKLLVGTFHKFVSNRIFLKFINIR